MHDQAPDQALIPTIEPLRPSEAAWRDGCIEAARSLMDTYLTGGRTGDIDDLDLVVARWYEDGASRVDINDLINAVGLTFGDALSQETGLVWVVASDAHGAELALHGSLGDILVYPANAIAKRVVAGHQHFVRPLFDDLVRAVRDQQQG